VTVDTYRRPSIAARGRYPDVYAEIDGLGKFAIEVQLSKPFAPEIVARHIHYEAEGVALLWVPATG
jgi:competence CoiA-like predicted nuclease